MATVDVTMPKLGMTMESAMILRWHRSPGDEVRAGEVLLEVETDKAGMDVEAEVSGRLTEVLAEAGATVPVGGVIARIATEPAGEPDPAPLPPQVEPPRISPAARRLLREHGLDPSRVQGTGPGGRVSARDVMAVVAASPGESAPQGPGPLTPLRRAVGERMTSSQRIPQFSVSRSIPVSGTLRRLEELRQAGPDVRVTLTDVLVWALARAGAMHPALNAHYHTGDRGEPDLQAHREVHVGLVVDTPAGLLVPVLAHADAASVREIARRRQRAVELARQGRLEPGESATITLSNLGPWGVDAFVAMLNPPEVAILAVGAVSPRVFEDENGLRVERALTATLTVDHRAADGVAAAQFLREFDRLLREEALERP